MNLSMVNDALQTILDANLQIGRYFKLNEFFHSQTAEERGITNCPHTYVKLSVLLRNIQKLVEKLDIIRSMHGHAVIITSGYRCADLNYIVDGHKSSKHMLAAAVDITAKDFDKLVDDIDWLDFKDIDYYYNTDKRYVHLQLKYEEKPPATNQPKNKLLNS